MNIKKKLAYINKIFLMLIIFSVTLILVPANSVEAGKKITIYDPKTGEYIEIEDWSGEDDDDNEPKSDNSKSMY